MSSSGAIWLFVTLGGKLQVSKIAWLLGFSRGEHARIQALDRKGAERHAEKAALIRRRDVTRQPSLTTVSWITVGALYATDFASALLTAN